MATSQPATVYGEKTTPNRSGPGVAGEDPGAAATPDDRNAFPKLTDDQVERLKRLGRVEDLPKGAPVFAAGDRTVDFFVVLSGCIEITDDSACGEAVGECPEVITVHGEKGFTGELDLFSDRKILVGGRMGADGTVIRLDRAQFREMMTAEPDVGEVVMRAFILRRVGLIHHGQGGAILVGRRDSSDTLRIERFLRRNGHPLKTLYTGAPGEGEGDTSAEARCVLDHHGFTDADAPVVVCADGRVLTKPGNAEVADCLGLTEVPDAGRVYDVAVVGAGPSGMAASVYAASEGLSTVVIETEAPGGQAGTSSRIENYLGFPNGVSGGELAARAQFQAQKFGATLTIPRVATKLEVGFDGDDGREEHGYTLHLDAGPPVKCRTVVVASGARWRKLDLKNEQRYEGSGLHYAATAIEAGLCDGKEVAVVGGGNSAGQAAVFMSRHAKCVHVLVRGPALASSMSDYLVRRIEASDRIKLHPCTEVTAVDGDEWLRRVTWTNSDTGESETRPIEHVFLMIGATPNSDWLAGTALRDGRGFVLTGADVTTADESVSDNGGCPAWPLDRKPYALESSLPGVFAVGDVRADSVKRVASAVGEGSVCVQHLHRVIEQQRAAATA